MSFSQLRSFLHHQRGAVFGIDARIALAVFAILAVVGGYYGLQSLTNVQAKALAKELSDTAHAVEVLHHDTQTPLWSSLVVPSEETAYASLFNRSAIKPELRGKWLGPYITNPLSNHPVYGQLSITKRGERISEFCMPDRECFLWVRYAQVAMPLAEGVDGIFDSDITANTLLPHVNGRVQWQLGNVDEQGNETVTLYFRAARHLN